MNSVGSTRFYTVTSMIPCMKAGDLNYANLQTMLIFVQLQWAIGQGTRCIYP